jgi:HrpA-like RNA helicase
MNIGVFDPEGINPNPFNNLPYSDEYKNLSKMWTSLPAYSFKNEIINKIKYNDVVLVQSGTGSGKTLLVDKYALHYLDYKGLVIVTLPKKDITKKTAEFSAKILDTQIGEYVGFQFRGENVKSDKTVLLYSTDGSIISMIFKDPLLLSVDILIIDEAHERSVQIDLLLYLIKNAIKVRKEKEMKPLKLIIMSATIDEELFKNYYSDFKYDYLFMSGKSNYEITSTYLKESIMDKPKKYLQVGLELIHKIVKNINNNNGVEGDILFFVTSKDEIKILVKIITKEIKDSYCIPLYSGYPKEYEIYIKNQYEFKNLDPNYKRKIIISTDVAESSMTIDGIVYVIDSGMNYKTEYNVKRKIDMLIKKFISKSQVIQRKGRAGRTKSGFCFHLYTEEEFENTHKYPEPKIRGMELKNICLQFMKMQNEIEKRSVGIEDVKKVFQQLIEPPSKKYIDDAFDFVIENKLIVDNILSPLGELIVETNLDIRDAICLHYAYNLDITIFKKAFLIISIYSNIKDIEDLFYKDIRHISVQSILKDLKTSCNNSEHILLMHLYNYIFENNDSSIFNMFLIKKILKDYKSQLYKILPIYKKYDIKMENNKIRNTENKNIIECFNYGYKSRIAYKKDDNYIYNGLICSINKTIFNTKKVKKIIFCKNIYLNGKFYISILSSVLKDET